MTIILTPAQHARYERGWWDARLIEDECLEQAARADDREPVVVYAPDQRVLFALTPLR